MDLSVYEETCFPAVENARDPWCDDQRPVFDPRGGVLASASEYSQYIRFFSASGQHKRDIASIARHVSYSPSGRFLLASSVGSVSVLRTDDASVLYTLSGFPGPQYDEEVSIIAAFSPDEKLIAAGGCRGFVGVWDAAGGTLLHSLEFDFFEVTGIVFAGPGNRVAVSARTGKLVLLDAGTGEILRRADAGTVCCASPDGKTLFLSPSECCMEVVIWDVETWSPRGSFSFPEGRSFQGMCVSPDGTLVAAGGTGGVIFFSLPDMKPLWESSGLSTLYYETRSLAFSPDGCLLCAGTGAYLHLLSLRREPVPRV